MDLQKIKLVSEIFTPFTPVTVPSRFFGRTKEKEQLIKALIAPGRHVVIFGGRGAGKTSLINVSLNELKKLSKFELVKYSCSENDSYEHIWSEFLSKTDQLYQKNIIETKSGRNLEAGVKIPIAKGGAKSIYEEKFETKPIFEADCRPSRLVNDYFNQDIIFFIDEFDRITCINTKKFIADTIKTASDYRARTKLVISGVSDTTEELIGVHSSTIRNLQDIKLALMPKQTISSIIRRRIQKTKYRVRQRTY